LYNRTTLTESALCMCAAGGWRPEEGALPTDEKADARIRVRAGLQLEGSSSSASDTHKERIAHAAKRTRGKGIELLDGGAFCTTIIFFCACVSVLRVRARQAQSRDQRKVPPLQQFSTNFRWVFSYCYNQAPLRSARFSGCTTVSERGGCRWHSPAAKYSRFH
jgi:hypothetical protein